MATAYSFFLFSFYFFFFFSLSLFLSFFFSSLFFSAAPRFAAAAGSTVATPRWTLSNWRLCQVVLARDTVPARLYERCPKTAGLIVQRVKEEHLLNKYNELVETSGELSSFRARFVDLSVTREYSEQRDLSCARISHLTGYDVFKKSQAFDR